uniref:G-protein coupled receptors family 1 profile domain-containing protein n=1 Tax=Ditylenchus dipsaci TaxID=166011 RepID=A0A915EM63_9BILA
MTGYKNTSYKTSYKQVTDRRIGRNRHRKSDLLKKPANIISYHFNHQLVTGLCSIFQCSKLSTTTIVFPTCISLVCKFLFLLFYFTNYINAKETAFSSSISLQQEHATEKVVATILGTFESDDLANSHLGLFVDDAALQSQVRLLQQDQEFQENMSLSLILANDSNSYDQLLVNSLSNYSDNQNELINERYKQLLTSTIDWRVEYIAHFYVMPVLLLIGFINQCLNLLTLSTLPPLGYMYLKASALADTWNAHNPYSRIAMLFHAHIELPLANSLITASALCLVAMTIDRYLSIRHPIAFFNSPDSRSRIRVTLTVIFILSFAIFIPSCWQRVLRANSQNRPDISAVLLNIEMIRSLRRISKNRHTQRVAHTEVTRIRDQDRTKISVLLMISTATFVVCTLPASLLSLFIDQTGDGLGMQIFRSFANCLQVSHYMHNFYLYTMLSSEYRSAFLLLIGCKRYRSPGHTSGEADSPSGKIPNNVLGRVYSLRYNRPKRMDLQPKPLPRVSLPLIF